SVGGTSIYGPLSAPILVLVWLYFLAISVLIGAAFNSTLDTELTSRAHDRRRHARFGTLPHPAVDDRTAVADEQRRIGHAPERRPLPCRDVRRRPTSWSRHRARPRAPVPALPEDFAVFDPTPCPTTDSSRPTTAFPSPPTTGRVSRVDRGACEVLTSVGPLH